MATRASSFDEMYGDALAKVNIAREAFGAAPLNDLPDAKMGDTQDCLFYRGLKDIGAVSVGGTGIQFKTERQADAIASLWGTTAEGVNVRSPSDIVRTISKFDGDETPHYNV